MQVNQDEQVNYTLCIKKRRLSSLTLIRASHIRLGILGGTTTMSSQLALELAGTFLFQKLLGGIIMFIITSRSVGGIARYRLSVMTAELTHN